MALLWGFLGGYWPWWRSEYWSRPRTRAQVHAMAPPWQQSVAFFKLGHSRLVRSGTVCERWACGVARFRLWRVTLLLRDRPTGECPEMGQFCGTAWARSRPFPRPPGTIGQARCTWETAMKKVVVLVVSIAVLSLVVIVTILGRCPPGERSRRFPIRTHGYQPSQKR